MNSFDRDDIGKLVIRLALGFLILMHGTSKIFSGVGQIEQTLQGIGLPGFIAYASYLGEVVGPLLLIFGFYSRIGAALIAANMIVAIALVHRSEIFLINEHGGWTLELQGMFLFTAIGLALTGAGKIAFKSRWN